VDAERGLSSRFTASIFANNPVWSPDGRTLLFQSCCPINIFRKDVDSSSREQRVMESDHRQYPEDWSRDGRRMLYRDNTAGTGWDLWTLPVTLEGKPDGEPKPYLRTPFSEWSGRFSPEPNPRWMAYQSDESGRDEIYIQAFPEARGKRKISTGGGRFPHWGPGGRELFYVSLDGKLMAVSLRLAGDALEPSSARELFAVPAAEGGVGVYDVSPDGQRFLVAQPQQASQGLTVIVNWPALLKKGASAP
jgi:Tol biopolymer transport system component